MEGQPPPELLEPRVARRGQAVGTHSAGVEQVRQNGSDERPQEQTASAPGNTGERIDPPLASATSEPVSSSGADEDSRRVATSDLECPLCYRVFLRPIALTCGHTYCSPCLQRAAELSNCCPECRAVFPDDVASSRRPNMALNRIVRAACPTELAEREAEARAAATGGPAAEGVRHFPTFLSPMLVFPNQPVQLHFFEPRYVALVHRCVSGSRRFAVQPSPDSTHGCVVEILDTRHTARGTFIVHGRGCGRYRAVGASVPDPMAHGLHYTPAVLVHDEPDDAAADAADATEPGPALLQLTDGLRRKLEAHMAPLGDQGATAMHATYGVMPDAANPEAFSLWALSVAKLPDDEQRSLLFSTDTRARINCVTECLSAPASEADTPLRAPHRLRRPCSSAPASFLLLLAVVVALAVHNMFVGQ